MDDIDNILIMIYEMSVAIIFGLIGALIGIVATEPTELEKQKGCIVHNDKIYCEVSNIEKGE